MSERPGVQMVRLLRRPEDDDGSFDLEFWRRVGHEGRFAAMSDLVVEAQLMRGGDEREPRPQRAIRTPSHTGLVPFSTHLLVVTPPYEPDWELEAQN